MDENNVVRTDEEIRSDLIDQMTSEMEETDSFDPAEMPEDEGGLNFGLIGAVAGLGAAAVTGGVILYKKVKSGAVKQFFEEQKQHRETQKEKRIRVKEIKAEMKDRIAEVTGKKKIEDTTEAPAEPAAENVDQKKPSKK